MREGRPESLPPTIEEYHEALNGLWSAYGIEFRKDADLSAVREAADVLKRGHTLLGLPVTASITRKTPSSSPEEVRDA